MINNNARTNLIESFFFNERALGSKASSVFLRAESGCMRVGQRRGVSSRAFLDLLNGWAEGPSELRHQTPPPTPHTIPTYKPELDNNNFSQMISVVQSPPPAEVGPSPRWLIRAMTQLQGGQGMCVVCPGRKNAVGANFPYDVNKEKSIT